MKDETYIFHQTPKELAKDLMQFIPIQPTDVLLEPFKGEGAFFENFPTSNPKLFSEIEEEIDFRDITEPYDWVITNPPFRLETGQGRVNSFWFLIDYYTQRANKGIAFLANDSCFSTLTPRRQAILKERGWGITNIVVCSVKKWRGRYFFIILEKNKPSVFQHLLDNY